MAKPRKDRPNLQILEKVELISLKLSVAKIPSTAAAYLQEPLLFLWERQVSSIVVLMGDRPEFKQVASPSTQSDIEQNVQVLSVFLLSQELHLTRFDE